MRTRAVKTASVFLRLAVEGREGRFEALVVRRIAYCGIGKHRRAHLSKGPTKGQIAGVREVEHLVECWTP